MASLDITGIVGEAKDEMIVTRSDMNHANEIYAINRKDGSMHQVTHENDEAYHSIKTGKVEMRKVTLKDGKKMSTWVIYPPDLTLTKNTLPCFTAKAARKVKYHSSIASAGISS